MRSFGSQLLLSWYVRGKTNGLPSLIQAQNSNKLSILLLCQLEPPLVFRFTSYRSDLSGRLW
jgi:hypothetical protein